MAKAKPHKRSRSRSGSSTRHRRRSPRPASKRHASDSDSSGQSPADRGAKHSRGEVRRQYRKRPAEVREKSQGQAAAEVKPAVDPKASMEETVLKRIEDAVAARFQEAISSAEVQKRIEVRLKEERAKLEGKVNQQIEEERRMMLARKRREQEERRRQQEELERILVENQRKVEMAQERAKQQREQRQSARKQELRRIQEQNRQKQQQRGTMQPMDSLRTVTKESAPDSVEEVYVIGRAQHLDAKEFEM